MPSGREVIPGRGADLRDHRRGGQETDPRDRDQQVAGGSKRLHHRLDPRLKLGDCLLQVADVVQVQAAEHRVMLAEPALQRHRQVRDLAPHLPLRQVRQYRAAPLPVNQGLDHLPPGLRRDRGGDRVDLDPRVLQHVTEPGNLADPLLGNLRPVADQVPHRLDPGRGNEAAPQQPALQQLRQPLRVRQVGLAPRDVLHVPGVADQNLLEITLHQRVVDRHRVRPGRLHRHVRDTLRLQPLRHLPQDAAERPVGPPLRLPLVPALAGHPDRDRDLVLADVDPGAPLVNNLHDRLPGRPSQPGARAPRGAAPEQRS